MEGLAYLDGEMADLAAAQVPLNDRGYLLGDGVFETLRVSNGRPFRLDAHTARMEQGLQALGLSSGLSDTFRSAVQALIDNGRDLFGGELYLRVNITTGVMEDIAGSGNGASVTGICKPFRPYPMQYYAKGVHLITSRHRKDADDPLSVVKHLSFLPYVAARREAMAATVHDGVLLNLEGRVAEASTSNIFAFKDDVVHAPGPDEGALPGVTRQVVLELIEDIGLEVEESLEKATLRDADEAWLTNTTGGVVPVTRFDDRPIGSGEKGDLTTRLGNAFEDLVRGGEEA